MAGHKAGHSFALANLRARIGLLRSSSKTEATGGNFRQAERARSAHLEFEFNHLKANLMVPRRSILILLAKRPLRRSGMRGLSMIAAALVLSCGAAFAQTTTGMPGVATTTPPALGMTSPLGTFGASTPTGNTPTGLPLGATEINPGGLSTTPELSCGVAGIGPSGSVGLTGMSSTMGMGSTYDGGGLATAGSTGTIGATGTTGSMGMTGYMGTIGATSGCTTGAGLSSSGTASPLSNPGSISSTLNGGTIPLGATELNSGGMSPFVTVPAPSTTTTTTPGMAPGMTTGP